MNHLCYKTIFSKRLGTLVAVGEHACSQSKGQGASAASGAAGFFDARFVGTLALGFASVVKARLLARVLGAPVNSLRWALVWAAAPAIIVGVLATNLPEWAELAFGIPAILLAYGAMIWRYGFGPEDRVLFRRNLEQPAAETGPTAQESRP